MLKWFGRPSGAPYESYTAHTETPLGRCCEWCGEAFGPKDAGVFMPLGGDPQRTELIYHHECHLRQVIGGLNHIRGRCTCCGGVNPPDPPWLTLRQSAIQAVHAHQQLKSKNR